jgi:hypothetical protein
MNTNLTQEKVIDFIEQFCDILRTNYQSYSIEMHRRHITAGDDETGYHQKCIDSLSEGEGVDKYIYTKGKKYAKIIHITSSGNQSAHAFVDMNTGDVYKSASWKAPAKGIRYNLVDEKSRTEMYQRADWSGSYLYVK